MIRVENINKRFGDQEVLKNISVEFHKGKTNLIIGRSGSGKTVLLKSVIGLFQVDSGSIWYGDSDLTKLNFKQVKELRKEVGMVFQGGALFDSYTVEDNVMFPLNMFSDLSLADKKKRVQECLERVDLKDAGLLYPPEISGGMQKRVAIARAIALNPRYLFCDEPNSGLDPVTAIRIDNLIMELTKEYEMTTIINTHDMNSVMEIGERILFINEGENCWEGSKKTIFESDNETLNNFVFASELCKTIKRDKDI